MSQIEIRPAVAADVPTLLGFIQGLADYEKLGDEVVAQAEDLHHCLFELQVPKALIAELDGKPVGMAIYFFNFSTFEAAIGLYLEDLFVVPEARGAGVGKALFRELGKQAIANNCKRLDWSVLDWNTPAIGFYQSLGAKSMEGWIGNRLQHGEIAKMVEKLSD